MKIIKKLLQCLNLYFTYIWVGIASYCEYFIDYLSYMTVLKVNKKFFEHRNVPKNKFHHPLLFVIKKGDYCS